MLRIDERTRRCRTSTIAGSIAFFWLACPSPVVSRAADTIEFLSGARVEGTVLEIRKEQKELTFEVTLAGRKLNRVYDFAKIHAVTMNGKRYVLNEPTGGSTSSSSAPATSGEGTRSRAEIDALIKQMGESPPDWYAATPLDFPKSLDLSWPEKPPGGWNNQLNVGQYNWDIINPNPNKWRDGVKLLHHLLLVNKDNPNTSRRVMNELGRMYHDLLEDYPRAAFWWRRAGADQGGTLARSGQHLAECYWRMGNKQMAVELLDKLPVSANTVKIWGDMGEIEKAMSLADRLATSYIQQGFTAGELYLHVGDALRSAGRYQQALAYYEKVLAESDNLKGHVDKQKSRARSSIEALKLYELSDPTKVADGTYSASSQGYEAPVTVAVDVKGGRILSVKVTQHREKQFYSAMSDTPAKIIQKQSVRGVDATSSATITSSAIINATAKALAQ